MASDIIGMAGNRDVEAMEFVGFKREMISCTEMSEIVLDSANRGGTEDI